MDEEAQIQNQNPFIKAPIQYNEAFIKERSMSELDEAIEDPIDKYEGNINTIMIYILVYDIIKNIYDPEHPFTLEQLSVVNVDNIFIDHNKKTIKVLFTPTIPHCSLSSIIGLSIKAKLLYCISKEYKVDVLIEPGKHITEDAINKQLCDKERVCAAFEGEGFKSIDTYITTYCLL